MIPYRRAEAPVHPGPTRLLVTGIILLGSAWAAGCSHDYHSCKCMRDRNEVRPTLGPPACAVVPAAIDFGPISIDSESGAEAKVSVGNDDGRDCGGHLELMVLEIIGTGPDHPFEVYDLSDVFLAPGEELNFYVSFQPGEPREYHAWIEVGTSDPVSPTQFILLQGEGEDP